MTKHFLMLCITDNDGAMIAQAAEQDTVLADTCMIIFQGLAECIMTIVRIRAGQV